MLMYMDYESTTCCDSGEKGLRQRGGCSCDGMTGKICPTNKWGVKDYPLASLYAPIQGFKSLYEPELALKHGTLFEELDLPFMGDSVYKGGGCRG